MLNAGTERQSHCQSHVPPEESDGDTAGDSRGDTADSFDPDSIAAGRSAASCETVPADEAGAVTAVAAARLICVTGPLSPGLATRTLTLTLVGDTCTATAAGTAVGTGCFGVLAGVSLVVSGA